MKIRKLTSLFVCLMLVLSLLFTACADNSTPNTPDAGNSQDGAPEIVVTDPITVLAASDMQHPDGAAAGKVIIENIVKVIKDQGIKKADGFLFCGDFDHHTFGDEAKTLEGLNAVKEAVSSIVDGDSVYIRGNHDSSTATEGISQSGNNDTEDYGVFVINEDDYMWFNGDEARIKKTATNLVDYLNEKLEAEYDKPIFVVSHLPLHYSMRTRNDGDASFANYLFNPLNEAGEKGLNIVFLYGHDHSNGWDDYLGGAAVYLGKGDKILIAQANRNEFFEETLNFTYMNAGFIGYYSNVNGASEELTMTSFVFNNIEMTITRYSQTGITDLKAKGVPNFYKSESGYSPDTRVISSPQTVKLTKVTDTSALSDPFAIKSNEPEEPEVVETVIEAHNLSGSLNFKKVTSADEITDGGRYVIVYNGNQIMVPEVVTKANNEGAERIGFDLVNSSVFTGDTITAELADSIWTIIKSGNGWKLGTHEGVVKFTQTNNTAITATLEEDGNVFNIRESGGKFTFESAYVLNFNSRGLINGYASNPASFDIYALTDEVVPSTEVETETETETEADATPSEELTGELTFTKVTSLSDITDGEYILIYNNQIMVPEVVTKANSSGAERIGFDLVNTSLFTGDTVTAEQGGDVWSFTASGDGWKIGTDDGVIKFTQTADTAITATLEADGETFVIAEVNGKFTFTGGANVLNYNSRGLINGYPSQPAEFLIYKLNK